MSAAPASASASAMARPSPCAAPVTSATWPMRSNSLEFDARGAHKEMDKRHSVFQVRTCAGAVNLGSAGIPLPAEWVRTGHNCQAEMPALPGNRFIERE
jgi:hypothetical protein